MKSDNETLEMLAEKADRKNKEMEEKLDKALNKKSKSKKGGKKEESPPKEAVSRETSEMDPVTEEDLKAAQEDVLAPDLPDLTEESSQFDDLAKQMEEDGKALSSPKEESSEPSHTRGGLKAPRHGLGEEITKEQAEKVMSEDAPAPSRGHRRTVIVRTKVVGQEDAPPTEEKKPKKKEEKLPPRLSLVREETGEIYTLDEDLTIGREDDNDIVIPNPEGHYVSAHHAEIRIQGKDIYLKDLDSTNGTYVNDRKVGSWRLKAGNRVEFADIKFKVIES